MRILSFALLFASIVCASSCNNRTGCTETTADNFDSEAKKDDGTCIPSRDKLIGNYTYTRMWTDVLTEFEAIDFGSFQITEANTGLNAFNMFLNGDRVIQGSISALDISIEPFSYPDTVWGFTIQRDFTGSGEWLKSDTVDMHFDLVTRIPIPDNDPPPWPTLPQTYHYFCTKVN